MVSVRRSLFFCCLVLLVFLGVIFGYNLFFNGGDSVSAAGVMYAPEGEATARKIAQTHLRLQRLNPATVRAYGRQLAQMPEDPVGEAKEIWNYDNDRVLAYVFQVEPAGYTVVPADPRMPPVVAYSLTSDFPWNSDPRNVLLPMLRRDLELRLLALERGVMDRTRTTENQSLREAYRLGSAQDDTSRTVWDALLTDETWNQTAPYNAQCPIDPRDDERSITGCTATAVSQVINFWQYPSRIVLSPADNYIPSGWGGASISSQGADLSTRVIDYNDGNPGNTNKAAISFATGVLIRSDYGSFVTSGYFSMMESALTYRLGYSETRRVNNFPRNDAVNEVKNGRPIMLGIFQSGVFMGHAIVCDGYNDGNGFFHLNYGWGGFADGFYAIPDNMPAGYDLISTTILQVHPIGAGKRSDWTYDEAFIDCYRENGGSEELGTPVSKNNSSDCSQWGPGNNGWVQNFGGGTRGDALITRKATRDDAFTLYGPIRSKYLEMGGPSSLGYPVTNPYTWQDRQRVTFDTGSLVVNDEGEAVITGTVATLLETATASSTEIELEWTDDFNNETGFEVERKTEGAQFSQVTFVGPNVTTYADTTLSPGTTYSYRVRASKVGGYYDYSNEEQAATLCDPPENVTATGLSGSRIQLSWDDVKGETGFSVERAQGSGSFAGIVELPTGTTEYIDIGLTENTYYKYRLRSINEGGYSEYSEEKGATTVSQQNSPDTPSTTGSSNAGGGGGGCFIATAAYGSYQEPHVMVLRKFRDEYLLTNGPGTAFVNFYYKTSPPVAARIARNESARSITRVLLLPVYAFAYVVNSGLLIPVLLLVGFGVVIINRKNKVYKTTVGK